MHRTLAKALRRARGSSELVVAIDVDIRGSTAFTDSVESVQATLFMRKVYQRLVDNYFDGVSYFKPTGDGLLVIVQSEDETLRDVVRRTVADCLRVVEEFPSFFD